MIDGEVKEVFANEEDVLNGGYFFDLQPVVFYVLKNFQIDLSQLPMLDQEKLFHRT